MISFTVYGRPAPQGSKVPFLTKDGKARVREQCSKRLKPYRQEVSDTAFSLEGNQYIPKPQPIVMELDFYLARPVSAKKSRTHPSVPPDLSKLIRSTEDALTGILFDDDGQIVEVRAKKLYGIPERVEIRLWEATGLAEPIDYHAGKG